VAVVRCSGVIVVVLVVVQWRCDAVVVRYSGVVMQWWRGDDCGAIQWWCGEDGAVRVVT
jgi:hypothetical protein